MPTVVYPSGVSMQASADCPTQASRPGQIRRLRDAALRRLRREGNVLRRCRLRQKQQETAKHPARRRALTIQSRLFSLAYVLCMGCA